MAFLLISQFPWCSHEINMATVLSLHRNKTAIKDPFLWDKIHTMDYMLSSVVDEVPLLCCTDVFELLSPKFSTDFSRCSSAVETDSGAAMFTL